MFRRLAGSGERGEPDPARRALDRMDGIPPMRAIGHGGFPTIDLRPKQIDHFALQGAVCAGHVVEMRCIENLHEIASLVRRLKAKLKTPARRIAAGGTQRWQ